jgi:hypothetical protein
MGFQSSGPLGTYRLWYAFLSTPFKTSSLTISEIGRTRRACRLPIPTIALVNAYVNPDVSLFTWII